MQGPYTHEEWVKWTIEEATEVYPISVKELKQQMLKILEDACKKDQ